ncbi:MAG: amino acid permease [Gemmatimonadota bacterium]|nr:amino acid permease [Gemmatimonadota bacterium]
MTSPDKTGYARRLGLFDATMLVVGGIIGAGIFLNPAVVAQRAPTVGLTIGVWVLGGAVALAGAFVFAELAALKPLAGGGYVYLRDALGPLVGFLYGWTQLLVINSGGIAAVAMTFASYATDLTGAGPSAIPLLAVGAIATLSGINLLGIKSGALVQNILTVLKLAALAALIFVGLLWTAPDLVSAPSAPPALSARFVVTAIGTALIPVLFAYGGWQSTNFVAAEMREPRRDLPRALLIGVGIVVLVYVLANIVYVRVLGIPGLAASTAPASDVMRDLIGEHGATFIALGIAVSTFGFLNLAILSAPRVYQAMAADGVFFGGAARLSDRSRVPAVAILIQGGWAAVLVATKTYGQLLDYVVFGDWIFFAAVGVTLFVYRRRGGGAERAKGAGTADDDTETAVPPFRRSADGFRCPGYPWVPGFFVVAGVFAVGSTVLSNPLNALIGGGIIALGVPAYFWWKRRIP